MAMLGRSQRGVGESISDVEMGWINLREHEMHPEWNLHDSPAVILHVVMNRLLKILGESPRRSMSCRNATVTGAWKDMTSKWDSLLKRVTLPRPSS